MNAKYIKKNITSLIITGILGKVLFSSNDMTTKIIVIPFLVCGLSFFLKSIFIVCNKSHWAAWMSKVFVIAFLTYWFGFLIYWDYVSIVKGDYVSVLFSLIFWLAGGFVVYRRFIRKRKD